MLLVGGLLHAQEPGLVSVQLRGESRTWTETGAVFETTDDARFQTERYGPRFGYVLSGLPSGPARLKLGFCEFKFTEAGRRVFDVVVNGRTVLERFDILQTGAPREAVEVARNVSVPADGRVEVEFVGQVDNAKVNYLRLYTADWSVEIKASDGPRTELAAPPRDAAYLGEVYETCIGKFGSRLCINPRPQKGLCRQGPLGHADYNVAYFERDPKLYEDPPVEVYYGVRCGEAWRGLPFSARLPAFTHIKQQQTLTSLTYTCRAPDLPVEVTYAFHAPFYPRDLRVSVAPYILLDVTVRNLTAQSQRGTVVVGQSVRSTDLAARCEGRGLEGVVIDGPVFGKQTRQGWLVDSGAEGVQVQVGTLAVPAVKTGAPAAAKDADGRRALPVVWADNGTGLSWEFMVEPLARDTRSFVYAGWVSEPILSIAGKPYRFKYVELFEDLQDVARFALDGREEIDRKVALFEATVQEATVTQALKEFLAFAFQSWVQNTFYCAEQVEWGAAGNDWFSVWEGCCKFHSTVDVEYNVAPLYFEYWPDLMGMTLREWCGHIRNGVLSHDMGMGLTVDGMDYPHDMEVEENTNFVLLLYQYWRQTGDGQLVRELFPHVVTLLEHVARCDTDGDGFHELGTYNTIDQGSPAIQYARNQVYLAVRALCAFECGAVMAEHAAQGDRAARWRAQAAVIAQTLEAEGWKDDHYVVALNKTPPGQSGVAPSRPGGSPLPPVVPPAGTSGTGGGAWDTWSRPPGAADYQGWSSQSAAAPYKPPDGWDGYSIYTTNGLLYPMRTGTPLPGINLERMRQDVRRATVATLKRYGSPHTDRENNMWVSQNIWRDMAAAYLGLDLTDNMERYWRLQQFINREKRGCFTDVWVYGSDSISLDYYPRGVAAFGVIPALVGLQVDRVRGLISVAPLRTPLRVPLLAYADWETGRIPWLRLTRDAAGTHVAVEGEVPDEVLVRPAGKPW